MYPDYKYQPRRKTQSKKGVKKTDETEVKNDETDEKEEVEEKVEVKTKEEKKSVTGKEEQYTRQKKENISEKKNNPPNRYQENISKIEFGGRTFPDYNASSYFQEKQNDDYIFDGHYSYQNFDRQYDHSNACLNPSQNQNIQTRESIQTANNIQHYDFSDNSPSFIPLNQDIRNEMTFRDKQMLYPNTNCKENVKTTIDMNFNASYMIENHHSSYDNDLLHNQCGQNFMNLQPLGGFIENDCPKEMRLMKGELTASFTNIVESLQNIH